MQHQALTMGATLIGRLGFSSIECNLYHRPLTQLLGALSREIEIEIESAGAFWT